VRSHTFFVSATSLVSAFICMHRFFVCVCSTDQDKLDVESKEPTTFVCIFGISSLSGRNWILLAVNLSAIRGWNRFSWKILRRFLCRRPIRSATYCVRQVPDVALDRRPTFWSWRYDRKRQWHFNKCYDRWKHQRHVWGCTNRRRFWLGMWNF